MTKLEDQIDVVERRLERITDAAEIERVKTAELEPLLSRMRRRNHYRSRDILGMLFGGIQ
jgi:hypothetical protein